MNKQKGTNITSHATKDKLLAYKFVYIILNDFVYNFSLTENIIN